MSSASSFDPYTQNVTFLMADGVTTITLLVPDIDYWFYTSIESCINFGAQLGACMVMFFVTAFLTRESQRSKPVYILNLLSLFLGALRALLLALYFASAWCEFYSFFSADISRVGRSAFATSVAGSVIPLLMTITVNMSLVLQAHTVCKIMERKYYNTICAFACAVLLLAIGFRFAECVTNSLAIMSNFTYFSKSWIQKGTLATETLSIWFFSIVFTWKLFWTVLTRKKMGWTNLNAMQVLIIMSGCTMIIPCKLITHLI
jgi:pheromone alpha factor receptor